MTAIGGADVQARKAYQWGKRLLMSHLVLLGLLLINGLANYFQASSIDKYLTRLNVNATAEEMHYLSGIILALATLQAVYLVAMHVLAWRYTTALLAAYPTVKVSGRQNLIVLLQPVFGLRLWYRAVEAKAAYESDRRSKPAHFLGQLWWVIMSAVVLFYVSFFWLVAISSYSMEEAELVQLSYAHFALAAANFWFLWAAISGWRAISRLQHMLNQLFADS